MKPVRPFSIVATAILSGCALLSAQPAINEDKIIPEWQMAFENLEPKLQRDYRKHMGEASRLFNQKRIIEALNEVAEARKLFKKDPNALNLLGACHVEFRNFQRAREAFEEALKLQDQYLKDLEGVRGEARLRRMRPVVNILFNLAEMDFVTRRYQEAHDRLAAIIPELDPENISMGRLIEFKYLLCKLKIGQVEEARKLAEKYDYLDDNPYYYYANSAICYFDMNEEKAEQWRASARRVFGRVDILAPWEDTMIEFGYVKSFYGGPSAEE